MHRPLGCYLSRGWMTRPSWLLWGVAWPSQSLPAISLVHTQEGVKSVAVMWARCGTKAVTWLASPRKDLNWDTFSGVGNSAIALYLLSSGLMPSWLTMWPANEISFPISNFLSEIVMLSSLHLCKMMPALSLSSPRWVCCQRFFWPREVLWLFCQSGSTTRRKMRLTPWGPWDIEISPVEGEMWWGMNELSSARASWK